MSEEERETEVNLNSDWGEDGEMDCDASDEEFDPSSIMDRVRGLCKYVRSSPQRRSQFEECVRASYQQSHFDLFNPKSQQQNRQNASIPHNLQSQMYLLPHLLESELFHP